MGTKSTKIYLQVRAQPGQVNTHNDKAVADPHPAPAPWAVRYGHGLAVDRNHLKQQSTCDDSLPLTAPTEQSTCNTDSSQHVMQTAVNM